MRTSDRLITDAQNLADRAGDTDIQFAPATAQTAIAYALIAIAQELHKINERAEIEIERQERLQERKDHQKEVW